MGRFKNERGLYTKNFDTEDDVAIYDKENPFAGKNLDLNELFYENDEVIQSIRKYYEDRKGDIKVGNRKELVEEFVTDMRWSETNEVSAATLAFYIDGASNESKNNFRVAYDAFKAMPNFYAEGSEEETKKERVGRFAEGVKDYTLSTVLAPSSLLSVFTGGTTKAAAVAANRAFISRRLASSMSPKVQKALSSKSYKDLLKKKEKGLVKDAFIGGAKRAALVELVAGASTNIATQNMRQDIGAQDDFSMAQLGLVSVASAVPGGIMGGLAGRKAYKTTKETTDLILEGYGKTAFSRRGLGEYSKNAGKTMLEKETKTVAEKITKEFDEFIANAGAEPKYDKNGKLIEDLQPLDKKKIAEGKKVLDSVTETLGIDTSKGLDANLSEELMQRIAAASRALFKEAGVKYQPKKRITEQVYDLLQNEKISSEVYRDVIDEFGINLSDFSKVVLLEGSRLGRGLQNLAKIKKGYLDELKISGEATTGVIAKANKRTDYELAMMDLDVLIRGKQGGEGKWWQKMNNRRKGLLVSQPATAVRNAASVGMFQVIPDILIGGFSRIVDGGRRAAGGQGYKTTSKGIIRDVIDDTFALSTHLFNTASGSKRNTLLVGEILKDNPKMQKRLFGNLFGDIAVPGDMQGWDKFINGLNVLNRGQEYLYRSAGFMAHLDRSLMRKEGVRLDELVTKGSLGVRGKMYDGYITDDMLKDATEFALDITFANNPQKGTTFGDVGNAFINFVNSNPVTSLAIPFPRFMVNALRYQYKYSPLSLMTSTGLTKKSRDKIVSGDYSDLGKSLTGSVFLGMAIDIRNSEYAGGKFYEIKTGKNSDKVIDTRALFPIPQYLLAADLIIRAGLGPKEGMSTIGLGIVGNVADQIEPENKGSGRMRDTDNVLKDIIETVTGSNFRVKQTGNKIVDQALSFVDPNIDPRKNIEFFSDLAGNTLAQFLQPLNVINDVLMQYGGSETTKRDFLGTGRTGEDVLPGVSDEVGSSFAAQIVSRLPSGYGNALYKYLFDEERKYNIDPTLPPGERLTRYDPIVKQLFGLTITGSSHNKLVFDYYGLDYADYKFVGGDAEVQRQLNHIFAKQINTYFTPQYMNPNSPFNMEVKQAEIVGKQRNEPPNYIDVKVLLREQLKDLKTLSREILTANNPALMELQRIDKRTSALEEQSINYNRGEGAYIDSKDALAREAIRSKNADLTPPKGDKRTYRPSDAKRIEELNNKYGNF